MNVFRLTHKNKRLRTDSERVKLLLQNHVDFNVTLNTTKIILHHSIWKFPLSNLS